MHAAAAGKSTIGIPKKVGAEFVAAGPKKVGGLPQYAKGSASKPSYPPLSSLKR
jgi:hypothetical protein